MGEWRPADEPVGGDADAPAGNEPVGGDADVPAGNEPVGGDADAPAGIGSADAGPVDPRRRDHWDDGDDGSSDPLVVWALAAVHAALLVVVPVAVIVAVAPGVLGDLLSGLSTWTGLVLYGVLWGTTRWTNGRLLDRTPLALGAWQAVVRGAAVWGALTGAAFLAELLAVGLVVLAIRGSIVLSTPDPAVFVVLATVTLVAGLLGALAGVVLAAVDLAVLRAVRGVERRTPGGE